MTDCGISRRELLRRGLALAGTAGLATLGAACGKDEAGQDTGPSVEPFTGTLRVLGLPVDVNDLVKAAAERGLGFDLDFERASAATLVKRAIERPGSFDVLSGYAHQIDQVWPAGGLVGLDRTRIERWGEVTDLYKLGRVVRGNPACTAGEGDAPFRRLYTTDVHGRGDIVRWRRDDESGAAGDEAEPPAVTGAPSTFGLDAIGYDAVAVGREPEAVSWAELLNERWRGRVALSDDPVTGLQDAALAARALGLAAFADTGNPTRDEIDDLVRLLLDLKARGHFRAFWSTFDESVELMGAGEVVVESMSWPAVSLLQSAGHPARYAAPPEGFRGWAGLLFVSKAALESPSRLQACYDYVNWWHSGAPGAILMRYGYHNAVQGASRGFVSIDDWGYWIEGEPAAVDLDSPFTERSIERGRVRDGGSLTRRACRIATWLSSFDESEYAEARWREVTAA